VRRTSETIIEGIHMTAEFRFESFLSDVATTIFTVLSDEHSNGMLVRGQRENYVAFEEQLKRDLARIDLFVSNIDFSVIMVGDIDKLWRELRVPAGDNSYTNSRTMFKTYTSLYLAYADEWSMIIRRCSESMAYWRGMDPQKPSYMDQDYLDRAIELDKIQEIFEQNPWFLILYLLSQISQLESKFLAMVYETFTRARVGGK